MSNPYEAFLELNAEILTLGTCIQAVRNTEVVKIEESATEIYHIYASKLFIDCVGGCQHRVRCMLIHGAFS